MGSMEIVRSTEYREDNQQVVMYIRDINDDYLKLLQIAMCHTLDSVGIVSANISQGMRPFMPEIAPMFRHAVTCIRMSE